MYMKSNYYLCENRKNFKDDKELYQFLAERFHLEVTPYRDSYTTFNLTFLTYLTHYLTVSELSCAFGPALASDSVRTVFARLVSAKTLASAGFSTKEGNIRSAYCLTKRGGELTLSKLPDALRSVIKVRRSGGKVPPHDYGVGISMLQLLLSPYSFVYRKEYSISSGLMKEKGSLCVDAYISVRHPISCTLCIEQDMGTEPTPTLISKLYDYDAKGLTASPSVYLIFSCHSIMPASECPSFTSSSLLSVKKGMIAAGEDDVYSYYLSQGSSLVEKVRTSLECLLLRVGVCSAYDDRGVYVPVERYHSGLRIRKNRHNHFSLGELSRYIDELHCLCNPYRVRDYNRKQYDNARRTYRSMLRLMCSTLSKEDYRRVEISSLLKGFPCYVLPSVLLSNYFKYVTPAAFGMDKVYLDTLCAYFPGMGNYSLTSPLIYTGEYNPTVIMRNCYTYDHGYVCIEDISHDAGAFLRSQFLLRNRPAGIESLVIVALCDNIRDAYYFCEQTSFSHTTTKMVHKGVSLYFLPTSLLSTEDALRGVSMLMGEPEEFTVRAVEKPFAPSFSMMDLAALIPSSALIDDDDDEYDE